MSRSFRDGSFGGVLRTRGAINMGMQDSRLHAMPGSPAWVTVAEQRQATDDQIEELCGAVEIDPEIAWRALKLGEKWNDPFLRSIGETYFKLTGGLPRELPYGLSYGDAA